MTTINTTRSVAVKVLTIVGFIATVVFLVWILAQGLMKVPQGFASLASLAESINNYRPLRELTLGIDKTVVNSGEVISISWTDMKRSGTYTLRYTCSEGMTLEMEDATGFRSPLSCTDGITFSAPVYEMLVYPVSTKNRFDAVTFTIGFTGENENAIESTGKVTVVNSQIPFAESTDTTSEEIVATEPTPVTTPTEEAPHISTSIPSTPEPLVSVPQYVDLSVKTLGIGVMKSGAFRYTGTFDSDENNIVKFSVTNIGSKTSGSWAFTSKLPGGELYESAVQEPLRPGEVIEFTLGFSFDTRTVGSHADIKTIVYAKDDTSLANNTSMWSVRVRD